MIPHPHIPRRSGVIPRFFLVSLIFATWNRHERLRAHPAEARDTVQRLLAEQRQEETEHVAECQASVLRLLRTPAVAARSEGL